MRPAVEVRGADISPSQEASFWSLVRLSLTGCWIWEGQAGPTGYGRFKLGATKVNATRAAYAICYGFTPADRVVRHTCDNPHCVRPDHLLLGTEADNAADRDGRGRLAHGERAGGALLTEAAVRDVRRRRLTQSQYAAKYGVSKSTVGKAQTGTNWKRAA